MTYLRLALALGALSACIVAFFFGMSVGADRCEARHLKVEKKGGERIEARIIDTQDKDAPAAAAEVRRETIVREITREVPSIIDRPVYRNLCIDADGLRLIERAVATANGRGVPAGGPDGDTGRVQPAADQH